MISLQESEMKRIHQEVSDHMKHGHVVHGLVLTHATPNYVVVKTAHKKTLHQTEYHHLIKNKKGEWEHRFVSKHIPEHTETDLMLLAETLLSQDVYRRIDQYKKMGFRVTDIHVGLNDAKFTVVDKEGNQRQHIFSGKGRKVLDLGSTAPAKDDDDEPVKKKRGRPKKDKFAEEAVLNEISKGKALGYIVKSSADNAARSFKMLGKAAANVKDAGTKPIVSPDDGRRLFTRQIGQYRALKKLTK